MSDKGEVYYYHKGAKATRWEKPTREVTQGINRRLEEERRQLETATEVLRDTHLSVFLCPPHALPH